MSLRLFTVIAIFVYACVRCWQDDARKTVLCFCSVNVAAFLLLPIFLAGAATGLSAAILLAIHQWQRARMGLDGDLE